MPGMIDLYRTGPYRDFSQEHRSGGTFGLTIIDAEQEAGEFIDSPTDDIALNMNMHTCPEFETNFGDGWLRHDPAPQSVNLQPARTECAFRLPTLHLRLAILPETTFLSILDRHRLPKSALDRLIQNFEPLPRATRAHMQMWQAANRNDPSSSLDLDGAFLTLLGELVTACGHGLPAAPRLDDARLARAVDYAETHIAAQLSVGELAAAAAMSPSAFSRAFKMATGETPWHFIRRRRLERAGEMLARTDHSLFEIALECGFADASHLARCWKSAHGTTPRSRD